MQYSKKIHRISQLEEEREKRAEDVTTLDSACTVLALHLGEGAPQNHLLRDMRAEAIRVHSYVQSLVCPIINVLYSNNIKLTNVHYRKRKSRTYDKNARRVLILKMVPFANEALEQFKVHREAYYGGTFTGNHAHKCLQVWKFHYTFKYLYNKLIGNEHQHVMFGHHKYGRPEVCGTSWACRRNSIEVQESP